MLLSVFCHRPVTFCTFPAPGSLRYCDIGVEGGMAIAAALPSSSLTTLECARPVFSLLLFCSAPSEHLHFSCTRQSRVQQSHEQRRGHVRNAQVGRGTPAEQAYINQVSHSLQPLCLFIAPWHFALFLHSALAASHLTSLVPTVEQRWLRASRTTPRSLHSSTHSPISNNFWRMSSPYEQLHFSCTRQPQRKRARRGGLQGGG